MTSSFILDQVKKSGKWTLGTDLGDSYVKLNGECHPDFVATPIGRPTGPKVCIRKKEPLPLSRAPSGRCGVSHKNNGVHKKMPDLYDLTKTTATQQWNPAHYSDRRCPYESDLIKDDYLQWPLKFDGLGWNPPREKNDDILSYAYSYMPKSDPDTGTRLGYLGQKSSSVPPRQRVTLYSPISGPRIGENCMDLARPYNPIDIYDREHGRTVQILLGPCLNPKKK